MIALIGAADPLTRHLAARLRAGGQAALICALGPDTDLAPGPDRPLSFRLEHLGTLIERLRGSGVTTVCLSGAVRRPALDPAAVDALTAPLVPHLAAALRRGDDGALRLALAIFAEAGFAIAAAQDLAPELLPPAGPLGRLGPTARHEAEADRAAELHRLLAPADLGQALVLRDGLALAVEAQPGTDHMLRGLEGGWGDGGLLYKAPKAGQDRRADLPAIGPQTIARARAAGLAAVAIEAGGVLVLEAAACARLADEAGMVLWARPPR
jgi:DUF1009 family protein